MPKGSKAQVKNPEENELSDPDSDDMKGGEVDLRIVDPTKARAAAPSVRPSTAAKRQQECEDELFKEPKFSRRYEIDTFKANHTKEAAVAEETETFSLAWSLDSRLLAAGCGDGSIRVYNSGGKQSYLLRTPAEVGLPTTCIEFRPPTASSKTQNVLLAANANGTVSHWHVMSQTCLYTITEPDNQVFACTYRGDGEQFVTGGQDAAVRVYEEGTKTLITTLKNSKINETNGHSSRIYAAKFKKNDGNVLLTGGWDNTVLIWDLRSGLCERSIYGPHICGGGLDINEAGDQILTASWKPENALQLWDFGTGKLLEDVAWGQKPPGGGKGRPEMLYSAAFSPDCSMLAAGGCGTHEAKLFKAGPPSTVLDRITMGPKGAYSLAFSPNGRTLAVGGGGTIISMVDL